MGLFCGGLLGAFPFQRPKESKVREFLTLKQYSLTVYECVLKFTKLSWYDSDILMDMRSRMTLFFIGFSHISSKEGKATMIIENMDISRLMVYVHKVDEENLRDRKDFRNKKANAKGTYFIIF